MDRAVFPAWRRDGWSAERLAAAAAGVALALTACRERSSSPVAAAGEGGAERTPAAPLEPTADQPPVTEAPTEDGSDEDGAAPPAWATWPMPNSPASGLPNPQEYDTETAGVTVDRVTGLMWERHPQKKTATFSEAKRACARLSLAGYKDWRLPSRIELVSIVDLTRSQPSIHPIAFPKTPSDWFWTGSVAADSSNAAWYVYFYFGYPKTDDVTNTFSVRCVRDPPARARAVPIESRYAIQAETVRDVATGLNWERAAAETKLTFEDARAHCQHLRVGGQTGWRVPSMPELLTLVDERAAAPTIDRNAFPRTAADSFWTSSLFAETAAQAWHVYFDHGNALYGLLSAAYHVRCVR